MAIFPIKTKLIFLYLLTKCLIKSISITSVIAPTYPIIVLLKSLISLISLGIIVCLLTSNNLISTPHGTNLTLLFNFIIRSLSDKAVVIIKSDSLIK